MDDLAFYIQQGVYHVLDRNALDHVFFFIALSLPYYIQDWKKSLWLITFFTLGHTITFGLSVYGFITIPVDFVEFLIPITILIPLFLNAYNESKYSKKLQENYNIYFSFFFGLFHGLGFSNYFNMLLDKDATKWIPLIEFSFGIEFAQIIVVSFVLLAGHLTQKYFQKKYWVWLVSFLIVLQIIPMLIERFPF